MNTFSTIITNHKAIIQARDSSYDWNGWMITQDWSNCTKPCDGGEKYLIRKCLYPDNSLKQCKGNSTLIKKCNEEPCQKINSLKKIKDGFDKLQKDILEIRNSKINFFNLFSKPLRDEKCIIKEGDFGVLVNEGNLKGNIFPVRVVLTTHNISVFTNDV